MPPSDAPVPPVTRLTLEHDLTIYHVTEQKGVIMTALNDCEVLEIDLSHSREIDTAGIQLLILAKRESMRLGRTLRMVGHSAAVHEVIDFFNLGSYFGDPLVIQASQSA